MTFMLLALAAEEAGHAAPASPFEVNFGLFFWTWLVFGVLMFVLWKFAFPAILKATEEREQTIARQLEEAAKANTDAQALLEQNRKAHTEARHQAQS
ncbi:MAG: ATP synthase F0 subunit B, partial [Gemmatimonadota bacterium]|nr:ATP synthase F0 subunit B [Gemmatimonadota bacterium]